MEDSGALARHASRLWVGGGLAGISIAAAMVKLDVLPIPSPAQATIIAMVIGWACMLMIAPWRIMGRLGRQRDDIRRLATQVRRITGEQRAAMLSSLETEGADELADLRRAVHDALAEAFTTRQETKRLQRSMDETIQRETSRATAHLRREATTDPLTGLGNRRALEARMAELQARHGRRAGDWLVVMLLDLDRFKQVNDQLGHEAGDQCLRTLGELLRSTLRRDDSAYRLGGDEFVVLMPGQKLDAARAAAERLSALHAQTPWSSRIVPRPTLSIGLAAAEQGHPSSMDELLRRADSALYASKRGGRNRVTIWSGQAA